MPSSPSRPSPPLLLRARYVTVIPARYVDELQILIVKFGDGDDGDGDDYYGNGDDDDDDDG